MNRIGDWPLRAILILCAAASAGCDDAGKEAVSASEGSPPAVTVARVRVDDLRPTIIFTGRIEAVDKVDLRARVQGFLEQRPFTEGQDVKKGDLLFVIEKAPYETSVAQASAVVAAAEASVKRSQIEFDRQSTW
jgi:membrane fusion protein (multidrug efflux system)